MRDLLPGPLGLTVCGLLLAALYAWATPNVMPERLPGLRGHLTVIALYVLFIAFIVMPDVANCLSACGAGTPFDVYTKVLSRFAVGGGLKLTVQVEVAPPAGVSEQKVEETKVALRELGLTDQVNAETS